jgi:glycosyltransferase involved in cell wall biosynthesis
VKALRILGTRGIPAAHGGFETFAEHLAIHLVRQGWDVAVYCQELGDGEISEDDWQGVRRIRIPVQGTGPASTIVFDWRANVHAARSRTPCLTLGYNTAVFCTILRLRRIPNVINMDGIEWSREKWGPFAKAWLWMNDWAGCLLGSHLVADHPEIAALLGTRVSTDKITTIAYGADRLESLPEDSVRALGFEPGRYLTLVARAEPENSILDIVRGFSSRQRGWKLAVLGNYDPDNDYHRLVKQAAGPGVVFLGAIYDRPIVQALRFHCAAYIHGHQVGGTNPSLVEALGAGNAVVAHDNRFNRWVAGDGARYFRGAEQFSAVVDELETAPHILAQLKLESIARFQSGFTWPQVLGAYETMLLRYCR